MNYTVYFRKHVWERLKAENNKSELINQLLEKHYNVQAKPKPTLADRIEQDVKEGVI